MCSKDKVKLSHITAPRPALSEEWYKEMKERSFLCYKKSYFPFSGASIDVEWWEERGRELIAS